MKWLHSVLWVMAAVVWVAVLTSAHQPQPAAAQSNRQVWVYYMGFWGGGPSWDMQANVLSDYPQIGKYDSRDPGVVGTQIDQAKGAGIDAFLVSWFGLDDPVTTTPAFNNLLDRAAERGFKVAAVVDIFNPAFNHSRDALVNSLNYLVYDRANHPGYLRYNGKPVIVFAFQGNAGFSSSEWQSIRNQVDPGRGTIWIAEGVSGCCLYGGAMDGMYAFNIAWADGSASRFVRERNAVLQNGGSFYMPTVHPGWDETLIAKRDQRPNPTSPRSRSGGQFLTNSWNGATAAGTDVILIVSWNEFIENSHIEPSTLYGTQSLDILRNLIPAWKAVSSTASPPPSTGASTGQSIEAKQSIVNVRSGPGTTYAVIGQIRPGTQYQIVGDSGSWWAIAYGSRTGYVSKSLVTVAGGGSSTPSVGQSVEARGTANVRSGPGTNYPVIGRIKRGTLYPIVGESGSWWTITFNGQTGYVSKSVVRVVGTPAPSP